MTIYDSNGKLRIPEPARLRPAVLSRSGGADHAGILVTQLYCPAGHPLISPTSPRFDGRPAIALFCAGRSRSQTVYLSPFQGDGRKQFELEFEPGELLEISCPVCGVELPKLAPHDCRDGAMYVTLFLTSRADMRDTAAVCNAWGCSSSFLRLGGEVLAEVHAHVLPGLPQPGFYPA